MFVYLSKKIAIPNNIRLNAIAWNSDQGYIAVCGEDGLLKVLKLEQASGNVNGTSKGGLAALSNLSMNQTLEGHKAAVQVVTWNEPQQKLTSSDKTGVIMVWMLYKGSWYEEMTNDRKKSVVKGMSWTSDGQKICIVYEDGAIIVGSVDGNRIWGKELKNTPLTGVQWSPDNRLILFSLATGECHLYDNQGSFVMKLNIQCVTLSANRNFPIVAVNWYSGKVPINRPVLCICYENGKVQIMRNENDEVPIIIDTEIQNTAAKWNTDGSVLAICGVNATVGLKETNHVMFYSPYGKHLRSLKIPGSEITSLSWEGGSLRIALAVDSFIYFANIRPDYMWCYFEKTVAFLNSADTSSNIITFWNTVSNQSFLKEIENPLAMTACNEHCVIAVETINMNFKDTNILVEKNFKDKHYQLLICNSIGTTVDAKYTDLKPEFIAMSLTYVLVASQDQFLIWHYHTPKGSSSLHGVKTRKDKRFHIDDTPSGVAEVLNDLDKGGYDPPINNNPTHDPICCVAMSEKLLLIARESGVINEYSIPTVALQTRHKIGTRAFKMSINCNSTKASIIDSNGVMTLLDLDENREHKVNINRVERKDVWAICWAKDNPQLLALMEKTRMYVLRGSDPEEPISCSGYICCFEELEITSVLLDDIISGMETPNPVVHIVQLRIKSLRDTEDLLLHVGVPEAKQFIEDNPHPRLWRLLAEASLKKLDLETAENAFVRCTNYPGIQLIKRLKNIPSEILQKAEICAFYGEFEEAEKLYMDADRRDLAINLRTTLCDWFRTVQLYRMGPGISDQQMENAWKEIGNHFANLRAWESAKEYYEKAHHIEGLMDSLYHLEQYEELENCINILPEKSSQLSKLAQMLASVGMCNEAVNAYMKLGDYKSAINTCVNLRQWGQAVELAQRYKMPQIGALLSKHATHLLQEGRLLEAVELQRKAGRYLDAAHLLAKLAEREVAKKSNLLRIKKLYILAGLLTEDHLKTQSSLTGFTRATILSELTPEDTNLIEQIWHCAEAFHFMLLAQRQLRFGIVHSAVITAVRLREYEDILSIEDIYSILALASCADRSFGTCSKAFIKLESLTNVTEKVLTEYEDLAVSIFSKNEPYDNETDLITCYMCAATMPDSSPSCSTCGIHFPACVASGRPITQPIEAWKCNTCHHSAFPIEILDRKSCPLCHSAIKH
ncbi:WD repeat-containing protein 35 [Condylostylus longicornis]|uniref:WD repeat-containing protein 35 n=1 Tax=Condylostylus longicornis TaxID=2530218 RepID=UPI00244DA0DA|nr:WD repeat-containing protein 35 [Condylostylus longicornis]